MDTSTNQTFKITVPITKCYKRTTADGVEKYVIEGMASNTNLDLTGERMADTAIKSMVSSLATHPVVFKNEHGDEWDAEFGEVTALYATENHELIMEAELDPDHYRTKTLVKALEKGKSLGLSIGGLIPEGGAVKEWVSEVGRTIKTYKDILLQEISVTGSPAVADTWLTNITKSVKDWKETPMPEDKHTQVEKNVEQAEQVDVTEQPQEHPEESAEEQSEAPTADAAPEKESPEESDAEESAEETPDEGPTPVEPEAPAQEDEEDVPEGDGTAKSSPAPADDNTSEDGEIVAAESEEVSKKLAEAESELEVLTKSLTEANAKVEELSKSLSNRTEELETANKSLKEKETELEKINARKGIVFDKFGGQEAHTKPHDDVVKASHEKFASFVVHGAK